MKTLSVQEASGHLGELLHFAVGGEEVIINDGQLAISLQPVAVASPSPLGGREALRRLQSQARLTQVQAEDYLKEVRAERLAHD